MRCSKVLLVLSFSALFGLAENRRLEFSNTTWMKMTEVQKQDFVVLYMPPKSMGLEYYKYLFGDAYGPEVYDWALKVYDFKQAELRKIPGDGNKSSIAYYASKATMVSDDGQLVDPLDYLILKDIDKLSVGFKKLFLETIQARKACVVLGAKEKKEEKK